MRLQLLVVVMLGLLMVGSLSFIFNINNVNSISSYVTIIIDFNNINNIIKNKSGSYLIAAAYLSIPGVGLLGPDKVSYDTGRAEISFRVPGNIDSFTGPPGLPTVSVSLIDYGSGKSVLISISSYDIALYEALKEGVAIDGRIFSIAAERAKSDPLLLLRQPEIVLDRTMALALKLSDSIITSDLTVPGSLPLGGSGNWTRWERYPEGSLVDQGVWRSYDSWKYEHLAGVPNSELRWWYDHLNIAGDVDDYTKWTIARELWAGLVKDVLSARYLVSKDMYGNDINRAVRAVSCLISTNGKFTDCAFPVCSIELKLFLHNRDNDVTWIDSMRDSGWIGYGRLPVIAYNWTLLDVNRSTASNYEVDFFYASDSIDVTVKSGMLFGIFMGSVSETLVTNTLNYGEDLIFADNQKQFYVYFETPIYYSNDSILINWIVKDYNESYWLIIPIATIATPYTIYFDPTNVVITREPVTFEIVAAGSLVQLEETVSYTPTGNETGEITIWEFEVNSSNYSGSPDFAALLEGPAIINPIINLIPGGSYIFSVVSGAYSALTSTGYILVNVSYYSFDMRFRLQAEYPEPGQDATFYVHVREPMSRLLYGDDRPLYNIIHIDMSEASSPAPCTLPLPCGNS